MLDFLIVFKKLASAAMRPRNDAKGFSLVEVIVASVIIGVLAVGIFSVVSYGKRVSIRIQEKAIAVSLVEKKMNELKRMGAGNIPSAPLPEVKNKTNGGLGADGTLSTFVTDAAEGDPRLKEVQVVFNWTDRFGAARTESAASVFYQE